MAEKKTKEQVMAEMELEAAKAHVELDEFTGSMGENSPQLETVTSLANWWHKWYLKAGHKRLGRMLMEYETVLTKKEE